MISHQHKCIFIHIPKCGGTSIESALGHLDGYTDRGGQDHRTLRMIEKPRLSPKVFCSYENIIEALRGARYTTQPHANINKKFAVTKHQYLSYFKFTIVRNPRTRAYSWYKNVMRDEHHRNELNIDKAMSFKNFLNEHIGKGMLKPQLWWIKDFSDSMSMDFIGRRL